MSRRRARVGIVTFKPVRPAGRPLDLHLLGDDELTGGVGGWEAVPRPRRKAGTEWAGSELWSLTLPLLLTGITDSRKRPNTSIEDEIRRLIDMGTKEKKTGQPPLLRVRGPLLIPNASIRWVITSIEWGPRIRNDRNRRIQQEMTVQLLEHVRLTVRRGPAAKTRDKLGL
jgi:hypothetical protein